MPSGSFGLPGFATYASTVPMTFSTPFVARKLWMVRVAASPVT